ncbi:Sphingosine-1-phosphate lyase 1 isoform X1 [Oopsacas minuta]|uniref:sphinganine-1-phosphate aldolase n=1 Tax=Oopsacas minuta TaxID=111878 RepID=A0AAV7K3K5_9METZ|nr:Sphingosine-1-phosphate lyase 1 isoform X1 [Oopsacas minuta]
MNYIIYTSLLLLWISLYPNWFLQYLSPVTNLIINNEIINKQVNSIVILISPWNEAISKVASWRVILITAILSYFYHNSYNFIFHKRLPPKQRLIDTFFSIIGKAPIIKSKIKSEIQKTDDEIKKSAVIKNAPTHRPKMPYKGLGYENVLKECENHASIGEWDWNSGKVSGTVYIYDKEHKQLMENVYKLFYETNPLHPDVFPGVRKMETEIVSMCLHLFHGEEGCGVTTSGGTVSILMAMKAYRELGYKKGIDFPEIILSRSTHPAFMKASSYFGLRPVRFKVGPDYRADVRAYESAINRNTVALIASAPSYPHGIIDPVEEIAKLGVKYKIGVHVDCCLGSLMIPFMEDAGHPIPLVDFRLEGVTSISCDTHKYGNGPKGSSVIMYRTKELRANQYFQDTEFTGGLYCSPGLPGSRNGSILASTWATMVYTGCQGYIEKTKGIVEVRKAVEKEVRKIPELFIFGEPKLSVVSFGSDVLDIYNVSDQMAKSGWHVNNNQFPPGIHMAFTSVHINKDVPKLFIRDLKKSVNLAKKGGKDKEGMAGIYGTAAKIPDRRLVADSMSKYTDAILDLI